MFIEVISFSVVNIAAITLFTFFARIMDSSTARRVLVFDVLFPSFPNSSERTG